MNTKIARKLITSLIMLYVVAAPVRAADSSACYTIGDSDARSYCLAKARKDPSACYSIQRADLRAQCLSETR